MTTRLLNPFLIGLSSSVLGLAVGCTVKDDSRPSAGPATVPAEMPRMAPPATSQATQPATAPAVPDPREAKYLTDVTQLTSGFEKAGEGYFSADMKWIIFQATPKGETQYQMFVASLEIGDGSSPKIGWPIRISPPNSRNTCGYFSPDGKTVILGSTAGKEKAEEPNAGYQRQGGNYRWAFPDGMEIYAAPMEDVRQVAAQLKQIEQFVKDSAARPALQEDVQRSFRLLLESQATRPTSRGASSGSTEHAAAKEGGDDRDLMLRYAVPDHRLTNNDAYDAEGSFSPDGKFICFTSRRSGDTEVWVMHADGSHSVQITHNPGYDGGPFFAPDGKRLIYRSDRKQNDLLQVFVSELAFDDQGEITGIKAEKQLTDDANVNWGPYFHPDNKHIIYATSKHGHANYELYLMRDDGSHQTRITYCAGFDGLPVFSPDGKYLMWSSKRAKDNTTQLFIAKYHMPEEEKN